MCDLSPSPRLTVLSHYCQLLIRPNDLAPYSTNCCSESSKLNGSISRFSLTKELYSLPGTKLCLAFSECGRPFFMSSVLEPVQGLAFSENRGGAIMRMRTALALAGVVTMFASAALGATISGTVKGPDGSAFKGAFVEAQNTQNRVTYNTLSHADGAYKIENLPAGTYNVAIRAVGFKTEPHQGLSLSAAQSTSLDLNLQKGVVRWTDLSIYQGTALLPDGPGKGKLTTACFACHGFQSRMASQVRDEDGWRDRVHFMRTTFGYLLGGVNDQDADNVIAYLTKNFGPDSDLPKSPADLPEYASVKQEFSDAAMRINYVTFEMPGTNRFPGAATPEWDGKVYIWTYN